MGEVFDVISQAMKEKKTADPADQLEYAAQLLRSKTASGSGTVYANGLETAAKQSGKSDVEALTGALMSGSTMAQTPHRAQSGEVVTSALLSALTSMMNK